MRRDIRHYERLGGAIGAFGHCVGANAPYGVDNEIIPIIGGSDRVVLTSALN